MDATEFGAIFSATQAEFVECTPLVWGPMGQSLVDTVKPASGDRVLDACCGAGSSAIPAAVAVGPQGAVDAVDVAGGLLVAARQRASAEGLANVNFVKADITTWKSPGAGYDVVQCAYGIFFLPDMDNSAQRLIGLLRPGGRFGVTAWRKGAVESYGRALYDVLGRYKEQKTGNAPREASQRISTPESLHAWLESIGLADATVRTVECSIPLTPDFAWSFVLGSGFRGILSDMEDGTIDALRSDFLATLEGRGIDRLDISTLVGVGVRR